MCALHFNRPCTAMDSLRYHFAVCPFFSDCRLIFDSEFFGHVLPGFCKFLFSPIVLFSERLRDNSLFADISSWDLQPYRSDALPLAHQRLLYLMTVGSPLLHPFDWAVRVGTTSSPNRRVRQYARELGSFIKANDVKTHFILCGDFPIINAAEAIFIACCEFWFVLSIGCFLFFRSIELRV